MNAHQRSRRNEKMRSLLLKIFVWALLAVFISTSVGVALFTFGAR